MRDRLCFPPNSNIQMGQVGAQKPASGSMPPIWSGLAGAGASLTLRWMAKIRKGRLTEGIRVADSSPF